MYRMLAILCLAALACGCREIRYGVREGETIFPERVSETCEPFFKVDVPFGGDKDELFGMEE